MNTPSRRLYVFSGAGLSAESGVSTFRTPGGLWTQNNLDRVCNALTWKDNRSDVFEFYAQRRKEVTSAEPNMAHRLLAHWQGCWGTERVRLLTQNVDNLLERAGATDVIHLHGDLERLHCTACGHRWPVGFSDYVESSRCPKCDSLRGVKPSVVFFHEAAPEYWHLRRMTRDLTDEDIVLVVGTSLEVVSVEQLLPYSRIGHKLNWQVNPEPVHSEHFGWTLAKPASEGLQAMAGLLASLMD